MHSWVVGLEEAVCSSVRCVALGESEGAPGSAGGMGRIVGSSWSHSQTAGVSQTVVGIVGNLGVTVGFGGGGVVEGNTAVSIELAEAVAVVGTAEWVGVQGHEERKVGAGRRFVVGIANTVARGDGEEDGELMADVEVGKAVAGVGAAVAASKIGYHHNRSSHTEQIAQQEDAVAGTAGEGSIASYKFRNQTADRDCDLR